MRLKWAPRFFLVGAGLAACLLAWFYVSQHREISMQFMRYVCYLGLRTASWLFDGPPAHITRTIEIISDICIVAVTGLEACVAGFFVDLIQYRRTQIH